MSRSSNLGLGLLAALLVSVAVATPAAADGKRCCFYIAADSDAEVKETFSGETTRGKQQANVAWMVAGIFGYEERGGFSNLIHIGPAHEHWILVMNDEIRSYFTNPAGTPVAEPGTCGTFKKKRANGYPRVGLFRGEITVSADGKEDDGCMYGLSMLTWDVNGGSEGYSPWGEDYKAPPRDFFRKARGTYRRPTGFHSTYSPEAAYGVAAEWDHQGFLKVEWFPRRMLDRRLGQLRDFHKGYGFGDACSHVPC
jgi:hypothetical protein